MTACPEPYALVEPRIDRVLTQYRESPRLLSLLRVYLKQVEDVVRSICDMPEHFDLDTATGDQLTLLGKRLGFPRTHCVCDTSPVFGFNCGPATPFPIVGFCENSTWLECGATGRGEITIGDDEQYRGILRARRFQVLKLFDVQSLTAALQYVWGANAAVLAAPTGKVIVTPGRTLSAMETRLIPVVARALPVALGIKVMFHAYAGPSIFGFGTGWAGLCESSTQYMISDGSGVPKAIATGTVGLIGTQGIATEPRVDPTGQPSYWLCPEETFAYECAA